MRISDWSSDVCSSDLLPSRPSSLYRWPCNQIVTKWALVFHFFCRRPALASVPSLALLRACVKRQTAAHGQNRPRVHLHHRLARVDHWRAAFAGHYRTLSTQFVLLALQVSHRPRQHCRHLELMLRPFAPGELSNHRMPEWPILLPHSNMSRWRDLTSCTLHDFYRSRRALDPLLALRHDSCQIGRESCRERVCPSV